MPVVEALLTPDDIANILNVSIRTVKQLISAGDLQAITLPANRVRIERSALEEFIEGHRKPAKDREAEKV